ncbi:MupG family TIM beta-alpha barrel fold protein [Bacillus bingmayongensis]|uniref:MupG family TIM beta-alpha barrel fold protein n=1 Tax=Bacillus bingmayongensis TaxID=1150157 RepID=UPI001C8DEBE0|nr:MupG family TIM beta-alpha barrel fold protein [Bacillus bingmayongensis]MBY0595747.1 MupG family TIM beta-alpha barrel fold protein [Bacillus bingmayongensis]
MLGYSIYFSQLDTSFIQKMDQKGVKTIFTSFHIPEEQMTHQIIQDFLEDSKENNRDVVIDISPNTLQVIGVNDYLEMKDLGVKTVRIDFGISDEEIVELQKHFRIVLNASTLDEQKICELQGKGLNLRHVVAMHNFYPREYTGISMEFFSNKNRIFQKYGIQVWAFIPGDKVLRGPIFAGLPTVEKHRNQSPYVSYVELSQGYDIDGIFIGDPQIDDDTLDLINRFEKEGIITLPTSELSPHIPKDIIYNNRPDESEAVIRIEQGRELFSKKEELYTTTKPGKRLIGTITVDNAEYLRYIGETQIMKQQLPEDPRVNSVGKIHDEYLSLLDYVKAGTKIKFQ